MIILMKTSDYSCANNDNDNNDRSANDDYNDSCANHNYHCRTNDDDNVGNTNRNRFESKSYYWRLLSSWMLLRCRGKSCPIQWPSCRLQYSEPELVCNDLCRICLLWCGIWWRV